MGLTYYIKSLHAVLIKHIFFWRGFLQDSKAVNVTSMYKCLISCFFRILLGP